MNNSDDETPDKCTIAAQLRELSAFIKLKGESNAFRAKAYDNAASAIEGVGEDISALIASGRLTDVRVSAIQLPPSLPRFIQPANRKR
jgi:DNA polymerase/3'-5' exonuclease PolX